MITTDSILQPNLPTSAEHSVAWQDLYGGSIDLILANIASQHKKLFLIITPDVLTANQLEQSIHFFLPKTTKTTVIHFPDWETLPYDSFSPHQDIISQRLETLSLLPNIQQGILIVPVNSLLHRLAPTHYIAQHSFILKVGDHINLSKTRNHLVEQGYQYVSQVYTHGEFSIRGSLIDIYPMGSKHPFRIDLFDNEVESIRIFETESQRSLEKIEFINVLPAKEFPLSKDSINFFRQNWRQHFSGNPLDSPIYNQITDGIAAQGLEYYLPLFFQQTSTLFDYLPENTIIINYPKLSQTIEKFWHDTEQRYEQNKYNIYRPLLAPELLFCSQQQLQQLLNNYQQIYLNQDATTTISYQTIALPDINIEQKKSNPAQHLVDFINQQDKRILFCAESAGRREVLSQLLKDNHITVATCENWQSFITGTEKLNIAIAPITQGMQLPEQKLALIAEADLFGQQVLQSRKRSSKTTSVDSVVKSLAELKLGDPVVHLDYGVGRYRGLETISIDNIPAEFIKLEYADNSSLYVPVASLHLVNRYTGSDSDHAPLHKLGTQQWEKVKRKAQQKIHDVAAELLEIYAKRQQNTGFAFAPPDEDYQHFASDFPFETTPDQQKTIEEVIQDMTSLKCMDRLVCGDVGFGKTEVAMRAAFLAIQNNKQVAILVPTTLLAQQHFNNFNDRFADWPVKIELLSRFRSEKQQQLVLSGLAEGKVDLVIATHKLLNTKLSLKNLGLLIIDEEHRFGVKQKDKLKALRSNIDILTLTATPIPRTLNMSMAGVRDLSIIATPPAKRLSVKTFINQYDKYIIQEAIQREILRGGQIFFLHNNVDTIHQNARELQQLMPHLKIAVAHGQMRERELENIMADFYHQRYQLLVCTTIIENGIDIPTANTIIINRADRFGLAQLHQLRGRVGRSHHQAYAYLLIPDADAITKDAQKRLQAIASLGELGIGFTLATHDLEIRGTGELLGEEQSGHMHAIGFSLYMELLERAVESLQAGEIPDSKSMRHSIAEINLHAPALIPENYLPDIHLRLILYKRIASAKTQEQLNELQIEMIDRFGLLPDAIQNLFKITALKLRIEKIGIDKIDIGNNGGKIIFSENPTINVDKLIQLIQQKPLLYNFASNNTLNIDEDTDSLDERVKIVDYLLQQIT